MDRSMKALPGVTGAHVAAEDGSVVCERAADRAFLIGSVFRVFVAREIHRGVKLGEATLEEMRRLDDSVPMPGPMALTPQRKGAGPVAVQEMIAYRADTPTDIMMERSGAARIRASVAAAGLTSVKIPDSTRRCSPALGDCRRGKYATETTKGLPREAAT